MAVHGLLSFANETTIREVKTFNTYAIHSYAGAQSEINYTE